MNNTEDYDKKLEEIKAIREDQIKTPNNIPVDVYIQEANNLYQWCLDDKETLTDLGLNWEFVTDLPARASALKEAESRWNKQRFARKDSAKKWQIREASAVILGEFRDPETTGSLVQALEDKNKYVRHAATKAFFEIGACKGFQDIDYPGEIVIKKGEFLNLNEKITIRYKYYGKDIISNDGEYWKKVPGKCQINKG